jgi:deoxyguanosine kinase
MRVRLKDRVMQAELICLEGNIGIGKTTLVKKLADHLQIPAFYEEFEENPWLPLFYQQPEETALSLEISFLTDRVRQLNTVRKKYPAGLVISDYCLDKCLLFAGTNLSEEDFAKYKKLHAAVAVTVLQPALVVVIHTRVENLQQNIRQRNRSYEQNMKDAYLQKLNVAYKEFFGQERSYRILNIFSEQLNEEAYEKIFREVVAFLKMKPPAKNTSIEL